MKYTTGLAVLLAGFIFLLLDAPAPVFAEGPPSESDSVLLDRYIRFVKVAVTVEEFSEHSFNSGLEDWQLDSMMEEEGAEITDAQVYYAPDSAFRIFVVALETMVGTIHTHYYSWLHFNDESRLVSRDPWFHGQLTIDILPDKKYLIVEDYVRYDIDIRVKVRSARVLTFKDHVATFEMFQQADGKTTTELLQSQEDVFPDTIQYMQYNKTTKNLDYRYGTDLNERWGVDSKTVTTGHYHYEKGRFVLKKETKVDWY